MGFFSWECAKSKKPVMSSYAVRNSPWEFASRVVVLFDDGALVKGVYDGYGNVNGHGVLDAPENRWRMVIERFYDGETFEQLPQNEREPNQGFFYDDADLERIFKNV